VGRGRRAEPFRLSPGHFPPVYPPCPLSLAILNSPMPFGAFSTRAPLSAYSVVLVKMLRQYATPDFLTVGGHFYFVPRSCQTPRGQNGAAVLSVSSERGAWSPWGPGELGTPVPFPFNRKPGANRNVEFWFLMT